MSGGCHPPWWSLDGGSPGGRGGMPQRRCPAVSGGWRWLRQSPGPGMLCLGPEEPSPSSSLPGSASSPGGKLGW